MTMPEKAPDILIQPGEYRVSDSGDVLAAELSHSLAVCLHDDTRGVAGVLHFHYAQTHEGKGIDLTDAILSSHLLLLDLFCKQMRALGARKTSWRVRLVGHIPGEMGMEDPAASVMDLLKVYFDDTRLPVECKELRRKHDILLRLDSHTGRIVVSDTHRAEA
jgi:chemotaxis receptor (MCP) glutamine deamidase CheD